MLGPCPYREAQADGRLTCAKVVGLDREVNADICAACPAAAIGCAHLRFSLTKSSSSTLLIRWGNGKQETLESEPAHVKMSRGACAEKVTPVNHAAECEACPLHCAWESAPKTAPRRRAPARLPAAPSLPDSPQPLRPYAAADADPTVVDAANILVFRRKTA